MKAAIFEGPAGSWPQKPMVIREVPVPSLGPEDVLIRVAACGLCRTDLEYLHEGLVPPKEPPLILGHEPSGTVEEVGQEVKGLKKGDGVLITFTITCGRCRYCRTGRENLCEDAKVIGASRDGAFAEYISVPAKVVYPLPEDLPLEESAIISDAIATPVHAVVDVAQVKPGDKVVICGASGGLGLATVQIANSLGAQVIAVGRKRWKLEKALEFGAAMAISTLETERPEKEVLALTGGGADIAFDTTGVPEMVELACRMIRPGGKIVVTGFSPHQVKIRINRLMWFEQQILGARTYRPVDFYRAVEMVRKNMVNIHQLVSHRFPLTEINAAYQKLSQGEILRGLIIPTA